MILNVIDLKYKSASKHRSKIEFLFEIQVEFEVVFEFIVWFSCCFLLKMQAWINVVKNNCKIISHNNGKDFLKTKTSNNHFVRLE